jgi:nicotinamidase-related amidase
MKTLILIDVQKGFLEPYWGPRNNPQAETVMAGLLENWRLRRAPVIHVQHLSIEPQSPLNPKLSPKGAEFMDFAQPLAGERVFTKNVNSAFIGTELEQSLRQMGAQELVFCGFTSDHCVSTSVRMAKNLGFSPVMVADALVTFDRVDYQGKRFPADLVQAVSLASLHGEFARVVDSASLI